MKWEYYGTFKVIYSLKIFVIFILHTLVEIYKNLYRHAPRDIYCQILDYNCTRSQEMSCMIPQEISSGQDDEKYYK